MPLTTRFPQNFTAMTVHVVTKPKALQSPTAHHVKAAWCQYDRPMRYSGDVPVVWIHELI